MYDTLYLRLTWDDVEDVDFLKGTIHYIENVVYHNYISGLVVTGNLGNLKISISQHRVTIKNSFSRWYLGDNFQTLERSDVQKAFEKLSDLLHLPIAKATITRLDIAQNFIVKHPLKGYLNHLGISPDYSNRLEQTDGLYYKNSNMELAFYDKIKELKKEKQIIPELYQDKYVLRYEQRYLSRLLTSFNIEKLTADMLYDEAFYINVIDRWKADYFSIMKINEMIPDFNKVRTKKDLYTMGLLSLIENFGGELNLIGCINTAQKQGLLSNKQAFDLRESVKESVKTENGFTIKSELIEELDKKIIQTAKFYR